jgi:hypothetical protein
MCHVIWYSPYLICVIVGMDIKAQIENVILEADLMKKLYEHLYQEASRKFEDFVIYCLPVHFGSYIEIVMSKLQNYWDTNFAEKFGASVEFKDEHRPLLSAAVGKITETNETVEKLIQGMMPYCPLC